MDLTQSKRPDNFIIKTPDKDELGPIKAWSYSARKVFEDCAYRSYLEKVEKIASPSGPAADRGSKIHDQAENFVDGSIDPLPASLKKFTSEFDELKRGFADGLVELEGEWGFTLDWESTGWASPDTWARIKLDAHVHEKDGTSARVIDYKTGKHYGNEIAHSQQALLYAIATFLKYPNIQYIQTEMWYLDHAKTNKKSYTREQAMIFLPSQMQRAIKMTTATVFEPSPNKDTCRFCSFKTSVDEAPAVCKWGVE